MAYATTTYLAILAATTALASTGVAVYGQQQQAKSAENTADYNAKLAENEARNVELEAQERAKRQNIQKRKELARIRNELSNTGTLTTTGTPLAILGDSAANMNTSIQDAYRVSTMQAASYRSQGTMGLWEASQARTAANLSSIGTGLSGISSAYTGYSGAKYNGSFTPRTKNTA